MVSAVISQEAGTSTGRRIKAPGLCPGGDQASRLAYALSNNRKSFLNFLIPVLYLISGIVYLTNGSGTLITRLTLEDNTLIIRWYSKILKKRVSINNIIKVTGDDNFIRIILKEWKSVLLPIKMLEPEEIRLAYKFLRVATAK